MNFISCISNFYSNSFRNMAWGNNSDKVIDEWINKIEANNPSLTSLSILSFRKPTQKQFTQLFNALKTNTNLIELYCSGKVVELEAVKALCDSLQVNTTLKSLSVGYATFGEDLPAVNTYLKGLSQFKGCLNLDLSGFGLSASHLDSLIHFFKQNIGVSAINLSSNSIDSASLASIGQAIKENCRCKTPLTLEISANPFNTLQGFFENFPSEDFLIDELNSYDNTISEVEVGQLISLAKTSPNLKTLRLSCPSKKEKVPEISLFEEDCLQIAQVCCPQGGVETFLFSGFLFLSLNMHQNFDYLLSLKSLTLRNSGMGDQYLLQILPELLSCAPSLEHLDLGENHLTDFSLWASLSSPTKLKKFCLLGNSISLENPIPQQDLTGWDHLLQLDLNCNKLTLRGFSQLANTLIDGIDGVCIASELAVLEVSGHCTDADQDDWLAQAVTLQNARPKLKVYFK